MTIEESTEVEPATFSTKDLNLAAYLWTLSGVNLIGDAPKSPQGNHREIFFEFEFEEHSNDEVAKLQRDYFNKKTKVEPNEFVACQAKLKHIIYENKGSK